MSVLCVVLALTNIQICRAPVSETPGESLRYNKNGKYYACCGVAERAKLAVADKNLVYDII